MAHFQSRESRICVARPSVEIGGAHHMRSPMEHRQEVRTFDAVPTSIAEARNFVAGLLASTPVDLEAVDQITAELAANAVLHARSDYRVRVMVGDERVRVEVANDSPDVLPQQREHDDAGGRGLHIVGALAADWGAESRGDEKVVWFELPLGA
jgi:anti-sigma regulatory factor (Ser/Thr protein kinase)